MFLPRYSLYTGHYDLYCKNKCSSRPGCCYMISYITTGQCSSPRNDTGTGIKGQTCCQGYIYTIAGNYPTCAYRDYIRNNCSLGKGIRRLRIREFWWLYYLVILNKIQRDQFTVTGSTISAYQSKSPGSINYTWAPFFSTTGTRYLLATATILLIRWVLDRGWWWKRSL